MNPIKPLLTEAISKELSIPIYINHIRVSLRWSGLDEQNQTMVLKTLTAIKKESLANAKALKQIKKHVQ